MTPTYPDVPQAFDPSDPKVQQHQLQTLRLELLSPSVMIALFQGIPKLVILEEPHHSVQFGILDPQQNGNFRMYFAIPPDIRSTPQATIPLRDGWRTSPSLSLFLTRSSNPRVIQIARLRDALKTEAGKSLPVAIPTRWQRKLRSRSPPTPLAAALRRHRRSRRRRTGSTGGRFAEPFLSAPTCSWKKSRPLTGRSCSPIKVCRRQSQSGS